MKRLRAKPEGIEVSRKLPPFCSVHFFALGFLFRRRPLTTPGRGAALTTLTLALSLLASRGDVLFVDVNCATPSAPYGTWATAATSIQDAVDAAAPGDTVMVTNGLYRTGGRMVLDVTNNSYSGLYPPAGGPAVPGSIANRVAVTKALTVQSVNGPAATVIEGKATPNGVRCVFLTNGAALRGFTLTNGFGNAGAGVWCLSTNALVSSCVIVNNEFGGAFSGTLERCELLNNHALILGGGALASTLNNCLLASNTAAGGGGGSGGGASFCVLNNCTLVGNRTSAAAGGADTSTLNNCIAYYNTAGFSSLGNNYYRCSLNHCCTTPLPPDGVGNVTNEPAFIGLEFGDYRLQRNSPCIDAGDNAYVVDGVDLGGQPRMVGGTVDIGAYEFQGPLLTLASSALSDGTFRMSVATAPGRTYVLESKDSLDDENWTGLGGVAGDGTVQLLTDPAATAARRFYRLRVE